MRTIWYLSKKVSAACYMYVLAAFFLLMQTGFNLYQTIEGIREFPIILVLFYAIFSSILIDFIVRKRTRYGLKLLLYGIAGFAFFLPYGFNIFTIIAGIIGCFLAFIYYSGVIIATYSRPFTYLFAILLPIVLTITFTVDFTQKKSWSETYADDSYTASFGYFNGKQEIPVHLDKGQVLYITIHINNKNGGGYGWHFLDDNKSYAQVDIINDNQYILTAHQTGTYKIIVTGDRLKGSMHVSWGFHSDHDV